MIRFRSHLAVKVICSILILTFITLDIAWAHPDDGTPRQPAASTLALPPVGQANPVNDFAAELQRSVFAEGGVVISVLDIAEYLLGDEEDGIKPLPVGNLEGVLHRELKKYKDAYDIDLSIVSFNDGVVTIYLSTKDGRKHKIHIAKKDNLAICELAGYDWLISEKYAVKVRPADYRPQPKAPSPESIISEPVNGVATPSVIARPAEQAEAISKEPTISEPVAKVAHPNITNSFITIRRMIASVVVMMFAALPALAQPSFGPSISGHTPFPGMTPSPVGFSPFPSYIGIGQLFIDAGVVTAAVFCISVIVWAIAKIVFKRDINPAAAGVPVVLLLATPFHPLSFGVIIASLVYGYLENYRPTLSRVMLKAVSYFRDHKFLGLTVYLFLTVLATEYFSYGPGFWLPLAGLSLLNIAMGNAFKQARAVSDKSGKGSGITTKSIIGPIGIFLAAMISSGVASAQLQSPAQAFGGLGAFIAVFNAIKDFIFAHYIIFGVSLAVVILIQVRIYLNNLKLLREIAENDEHVKRGDVRIVHLIVYWSDTEWQAYMGHSGIGTEGEERVIASGTYADAWVVVGSEEEKEIIERFNAIVAAERDKHSSCGITRQDEHWASRSYAIEKTRGVSQGGAEDRGMKEEGRETTNGKGPGAAGTLGILLAAMLVSSGAWADGIATNIGATTMLSTFYFAISSHPFITFMFIVPAITGVIAGLYSHRPHDSERNDLAMCLGLLPSLLFLVINFTIACATSLQTSHGGFEVVFSYIIGIFPGFLSACLMMLPVIAIFFLMARITGGKNWLHHEDLVQNSYEDKNNDTGYPDGSNAEYFDAYSGGGSSAGYWVPTGGAEEGTKDVLQEEAATAEKPESPQGKGPGITGTLSILLAAMLASGFASAEMAGTGYVQGRLPIFMAIADSLKVFIFNHPVGSIILFALLVLSLVRLAAYFSEKSEESKKHFDEAVKSAGLASGSHDMERLVYRSFLFTSLRKDHQRIDYKIINKIWKGEWKALLIKSLIDFVKDMPVYHSGKAEGARIFAAIGDSSPQVIDALKAVMVEGNSTAKLEAALALKRLGWRPATKGEEILYRISNKDWDRLVELGDEAVEPLKKASETSDNLTNALIARTLYRLGADRGWVIALLVNIFAKQSLYTLEDGIQIRRKILKTLAVVAGREQVKPLYNILTVHEKLSDEQVGLISDAISNRRGFTVTYIPVVMEQVREPQGYDGAWDDGLEVKEPARIVIGSIDRQAGKAKMLHLVAYNYISSITGGIFGLESIETASERMVGAEAWVVEGSPQARNFYAKYSFSHTTGYNKKITGYVSVVETKWTKPATSILCVCNSNYNRSPAMQMVLAHLIKMNDLSELVEVSSSAAGEASDLGWGATNQALTAAFIEEFGAEPVKVVSKPASLDQIRQASVIILANSKLKDTLEARFTGQLENKTMVVLDDVAEEAGIAEPTDALSKDAAILSKVRRTIEKVIWPKVLIDHNPQQAVIAKAGDVPQEGAEDRGTKDEGRSTTVASPGESDSISKKGPGVSGTLGILLAAMLASGSVFGEGVAGGIVEETNGGIMSAIWAQVCAYPQLAAIALALGAFLIMWNTNFWKRPIAPVRYYRAVLNSQKSGSKSRSINAVIWFAENEKIGPGQLPELLSDLDAAKVLVVKKALKALKAQRLEKDKARRIIKARWNDIENAVVGFSGIGRLVTRWSSMRYDIQRADIMKLFDVKYEDGKFTVTGYLTPSAAESEARERPSRSDRGGEKGHRGLLTIIGPIGVCLAAMATSGLASAEGFGFAKERAELEFYSWLGGAVCAHWLALTVVAIVGGVGAYLIARYQAKKRLLEEEKRSYWIGKERKRKSERAEFERLVSPKIDLSQIRFDGIDIPSLLNQIRAILAEYEDFELEFVPGCETQDQVMGSLNLPYGDIPVVPAGCSILSKEETVAPEVVYMTDVIPGNWPGTGNYLYTYGIPGIKTSQILNVKPAGRKRSEIKEQSADAGIFAEIETYVNNVRARMVNVANGLMSSDAPSAKGPTEAKIDRSRSTAEVMCRITETISAAVMRNRIENSGDVARAIEELKSGLDELEANGIFSSLITQTRDLKQAKETKKRVLIGIGTGWIPAYGKKGSLQHSLMNAFLSEMRSVIYKKMLSLGLDNIEIITGSDNDVANTLKMRADITGTSLSNVVAIASQESVEKSEAFDPLRSTETEARAYLVGINPQKLLEAYEKYGESVDNQIDVNLTHLLLTAVDFAANGELPNIPMVDTNRSNAARRILIMCPSAEIKRYRDLKVINEGRNRILAAA